jgi:hypothetical protein
VIVVCECDDDTLPGVAWPMASDGDDRWPYVERCDLCQRFGDDVDAAHALAAKLDGLVIWHMLYDDTARRRWQPAVHATRPQKGHMTSRDEDKHIDLNEDPDYEGNFEHEQNGEGRGANGVTNQLCIRDPDHTNEYVTDAPIATVTIDIGGSWRDYKHFAGDLAAGEAEAVQYERHILAEVAHLPPDNPVRKRAEEFFADARQVGS